MVPTTSDLHTTRYSRVCSDVCVHCGGGGDGYIADTRYYILTSIFYTYTVDSITDFAYMLHNAMHEISYHDDTMRDTCYYTCDMRETGTGPRL